MIEGAWQDDLGRVLEISRSGEGTFSVTARPGEGRPPFPPSNLLGEDTVLACDLPAEPCESNYPLPPGSPGIRVETGAPGYGRTLHLTLVFELDADAATPTYRAPAAGDARTSLRLIPEIGGSYLDAVAYHPSEEIYERLPWAEPLGPYRPRLSDDTLRRAVAALCEERARALATPAAVADLAEILGALHRLHAPLAACGPIAALRLLGEKVDAYSYGAWQVAASAWLATPSPEAAAHLAAAVDRERSRVDDGEALGAIDATVRALREPDAATPAIAASDGYAHVFLRCRFIPVRSVEQGRRLLAWKILDEALSWALGRPGRVARPRGCAADRYFDERRDAGNFWNNDVEHFIVDSWTGEWVLTFYANERNSSDTYEGCRGVSIDVANRCVVVRKYDRQPDETVPLPDEAQP